jgi:hypothetical protein
MSEMKSVRVTSLRRFEIARALSLAIIQGNDAAQSIFKTMITQKTLSPADVEVLRSYLRDPK